MWTVRNTAKRILALIIVSLPLACFESGTGPDKESSNILIPLRKGNQWNFARFYYDSLGQVTGSQPESLLVQGDTMIDGKRWFYQNYFGHFLGYRNSDTGPLMRLVSPHTDGKVALAYQYPSKVAETFQFPTVYFAGDSAWIVDTLDRSTVVAVDTLISVPAGTFRCIQYRIVRLDFPGWRDEFLSPRNGWIRKDNYSRFRPNGPLLRVNSLQAVRIHLE